MDAKGQLGRGLLWLGSAQLASKALDALTGPLVLGFLSTEELGIATIAWTVTTFVETFSGLGIGVALVQASALDERVRASAHWYALGAASVLAVLVYAVAPSIAAAYGNDALVALVRVSAAKLIFVGMAHVPLAVASRGLRFERLGAITTLATLLSSVLTIALAALGYGAWAPLLGNTAHGAFQLLGVALIAPYFPRPRLVFSELSALARLGWSLTASSAAGQLTRNLDYLLLGQWGGLAALGTYRVAFDLAMAPALAIAQVSSRFALPIYSRLAPGSAEQRAALSWTSRSTVLLLLAPLLLVFFEGVDLFQLLGKTAHVETRLTLRLLCVAALLRGLSQNNGPLLVAAGRARAALVEALISALLLGATLTAGLAWLAPWPVEVRLASGWLAAYAVLLPVDVALIAAVVPGMSLTSLRAVLLPLALALAVGALWAALEPLTGLGPGGVRLCVHGGCLLALYALGARLVAGFRRSDLARIASK
jgi:O-antigen/teichoic acid export membrane protein